MIRVLIVDDSAFVRKALSRMLGGADDIEVVGTAVDGQDGVEKVLALRPDVVTLDVKMPRLDGLEALRRIMAECPTAVLLLSSLTGEGADVTLRGLDLGALDFVDKSSVEGHMNLLSLADELIEKVRGLARAQRRSPVAVRSTQLPLPEFARERADLVVIGTSTGGPAALQTVIPALPADLRVPVLVVQHMPIGFTRSLAIELAPRHVRVNAIGPGVIEVPRYFEMPGYTTDFGHTLIPWGRVGNPMDIAPAVAFLAGDGAEFITGQTLYVDGGAKLVS